MLVAEKNVESKQAGPSLSLSLSLPISLSLSLSPSLSFSLSLSLIEPPREILASSLPMESECLKGLEASAFFRENRKKKLISRPPLLLSGVVRLQAQKKPILPDAGSVVCEMRTSCGYRRELDIYYILFSLSFAKMSQRIFMSRPTPQWWWYG